ncbi:DUF2067 family protein [Caldivirga maquilingensis]|uniref:DUF2067 domain-containing protein n=1 Tax=Caldivirga maquilingensis (strain ATCC 700844 / DSM 13496 / JCM 10307 / IC-167) TaxID=397948 RepID=A8MB33_CALMQ|nr:DUF2067 family protein [Caldivirga maquilingensis]ABW02662.1 conserved hypothetical protein [Caldivirga maquilingensis IC-167]
MGVVVSRRLMFKVRSTDEAVRFINTYLSEVKAKEVYVKYRGSRLEVKVRGNPVLAKVLSTEAHKVYGTLRQGRLINVFDLTVIIREAKPKSPIPPETIELTLRLMGYYAELNESRLRTGASLSKVIETVRRLSEAYAAMVDLDISSSAKRIIASLAVAKGVSIYDAIDELVNMDVLNKGKVNGREYITLKANLNDIVNMLTSMKKH